MSNVLSKVALAAAVLMGVATSADAFVVLTMRDLSTATTKTCDTFVGGCGPEFTILNPNFVNFSGSVGVFNVAATQGLNNLPGLPSGATSDTTSLTVFRTDGDGSMDKNLVVDFVSYVFSQPMGILKNLDGSASQTAGSTAFAATDLVNTTFSVDSDASKTFVAGPTISNTSCLMVVSTNASCAAPRILWSDAAAGVPGFSTRTQQTFQIAATSRINTTSSLTITVPEPMSLSLVGAALLGLGLASRRRRAASTAA